MCALLCAGCGKYFEPRNKAGRPRERCYECGSIDKRTGRVRDCANGTTLTRPSSNRCKTCGKEWIGRKRRYCSSDCWPKSRGKRTLIFFRKCPLCDVFFPVVKSSKSVCCCKSHAQTWREAKKYGSYEAWLKAKRYRRSGSAHIRRAKLYGVKYQYVNKLKVFERDKWICQICNQPVNKDLRWPHPQAASLDHVRPMSRGGEHSYKNTQCSHYECNHKKRDLCDLENQPNSISFMEPCEPLGIASLSQTQLEF